MENFKRASITVPRLRLIALALASTLALAACGGGGGSPGTTGAGATTVGAGTAGIPTKVEYVPADPVNTTITLKGKATTTLSDTTRMTFKVTDATGRPVADQPVTFTSTLTTTEARITLASKKTEADGSASAIVGEGISPVALRVIITLPGTAINGQPNLTAQSDIIKVILP
jgi:hypothetical protein